MILVIYNSDSPNTTRAAALMHQYIGETQTIYFAMPVGFKVTPASLLRAYAPQAELVFLLDVGPSNTGWLYDMSRLFSTILLMATGTAADQAMEYLRTSNMWLFSLHRAPRAASVFQMVVQRFGECRGHLATADEIAIQAINCNIQTNPLLWTQLATPLDEAAQERLATIDRLIAQKLARAPIYRIQNMICLEMESVTEFDPCKARMARALATAHAHSEVCLCYFDPYDDCYIVFLFGKHTPMLEYMRHDYYKEALVIKAKQWKSWQRQLPLQLLAEVCERAKLELPQSNRESSRPC
jgi:hypothetical protein